MQSEAALTQSCQLKGSLLTLTILELYDADLANIKAGLERKAQEAPSFFRDTPVVLSLEHLPESAEIDFPELIDIAKSLGIIIMAVRGGAGLQLGAASKAGLAKIPYQRQMTKAKEVTAQKQQRREAPVPQKPVPAAVESKPAAANIEPPQNRTFSQPIRSGQQLYIKGDATVAGAISSGAELITEGHIHVYGTLRGRALAGVRGDQQARIFCKSLEAEIVSIAGHYMLSEDLQKTACWQKPAQVYLDGEKLVVQPL